MGMYFTKYFSYYLKGEFLAKVIDFIEKGTFLKKTDLQHITIEVIKDNYDPIFALLHPKLASLTVLIIKKQNQNKNNENKYKIDSNINKNSNVSLSVNELQKFILAMTKMDPKKLIIDDLILLD